MKKAFTLIELIFVIVIIGLLAAVAVPKFLNLKQSAEAHNVAKTTIDMAQQAAEVAVNQRDLEDNVNFTLRDLIKLDGKGWKYVEEQNGSYEYNDTVTGELIAKITLYSIDNPEANDTINYKIDCNKFRDPRTQAKCKKVIGDKDSIDINITY